MLLDYFAKKNRHRKTTYRNNVPLDDVIKEEILMPEMTHFAIVKDNVVAEIIVVNPVIAETLNYKKIKFVKFDPSNTLVYRGIKFVNNQFIDINKESESVDEKD